MRSFFYCLNLSEIVCIACLLQNSSMLHVRSSVKFRLSAFAKTYFILAFFRCQQSILLLAQGQRVDPDERAKITVSIRNLVCSSQNLANALFHELFDQPALPSALKQYASTFGNCSSINDISNLWNQFYTVIVPNLHSVLYAFEVR
jgi:hypothetical protein